VASKPPEFKFSPLPNQRRPAETMQHRSSSHRSASALLTLAGAACVAFVDGTSKAGLEQVIADSYVETGLTVSAQQNPLHDLLPYHPSAALCCRCRWFVMLSHNLPTSTRRLYAVRHLSRSTLGASRCTTWPTQSHQRADLPMRTAAWWSSVTEQRLPRTRGR
jgi:hypothetical protein